RDEIAGSICRKRRFNEMRIGGDEIFRLAVQVSEVASPTSGNQDLFANAPGTFEHSNALFAFSGFDGAHEAGCSTTENDDIKFVRHDSDFTSDRKSAGGSH